MAVVYASYSLGMEGEAIKEKRTLWYRAVSQRKLAVECVENGDGERFNRSSMICLLFS